ncbi:protein kinase [Kitasatospora sp. NPDC057015]|uniref:protein kinase domain-containing protein n=1 Tax=Kitasatospora sp. NPDC057015 TaxID=3346001 RepID=UPI003638B31B
MDADAAGTGAEGSDATGAGAEQADGTGGWVLPGYTHGRELGTGASGRVVLATHDATGTPVAVKYLNRSAAGDNLRAEAEVLGALRSPYVTRLYEYVESSRGCAIVMELVDGLALRTLLRAEGATTPRAALVVLKGSLLGLAAAHAAGVVHRDYKPGNVLVAADGSSKLVDFGIAVRSGDDRDISGTPAYLAPEQWAGRPASPAADVYSATVTFFECLTGARPYDGATIAELAVQHTEAPIPDELAPAEVRPLIRAGLAKTPASRPDSAASFVTELEAVAVAGYGPDWEERGRAELAALVLALAMLLPWGGAGAGDGGTALAHTSLAQSGPPPAGPGPQAGLDGARAVRRSGLGRRAKVLAGAGVGLLVAGSFAGVAVAGSSDRDARTVLADPSPVATTTLGAGLPTSAAPPTGAPTSDPTATDSPSASPSPSASLSAAPTPGATVTTRPPTVAPTATGKPTAPATSPAPPTPTATTPSATVAPPPVKARVTYLSLDAFTCGGPYDTKASVTVQTDGAADVVLTLSWIHRVSARTAPVVAATQTVVIPKGSTGFKGASYPHVFGSADTYPIWGLQISTSPAAEPSRVVPVLYRDVNAYTCNPPR